MKNKISSNRMVSDQTELKKINKLVGKQKKSK